MRSAARVASRDPGATTARKYLAVATSMVADAWLA